MATRLNLDEQLRQIVPNVYYQPPATVKMKYPCIRYSKNKGDGVYANGKRYIKKTSYSITLIDTKADSVYQDLLEELDYCSNDRVYHADGLYHYVYTIVI